MHFRAYALAVLATCLSVACSEHPTAPTTAANVTTPRTSRGPTGPALQRAALLTDVPVTGTLVGGGTFDGTFTATNIAIDQVTRQLTMTGVLNGTAVKSTGEVVDVANQPFTAPLSLSQPGATTGLIRPAAQASCGILDLVLGPLHLDLLGLVVDLNQVVLDITAQSGAGNLLGNLLCAITGLLDLPGALAAVSHILDNINTILSGLTTPGVGGVVWIVPQTGIHRWSA